MNNLSLKIEKLVPGGQGIGTLPDGKKIFLWNALPGEVISEIEITKTKSHYVEGVATQVVKKSEKRIAPRDDCYLSTSPWQVLDYHYELEEKHAILKEIFRQHELNFSGEIAKVQTDEKNFFYRNKMEYSLYYDHSDEKIHLAFHQRGSHRKTPISQSSIEQPEIFQRATEIIAELNIRHEDSRKFQSLLLRCNQNGEVSGGLYENHRPHPRFPLLEDTILGQKFSYSPNGFFQINLPVYELALAEIKKHIKTEKVLDLYAGVGTIGLSVASGQDLVLVECDKAAYRELEQNTKMCGARSVYAKSEDALGFVTPDETVILDPPRAGCHVNLLNKLLERTPPIVIYLSCNPATQARDVKILSEKYQISSVVPFNFFPRTPHLENLVVLERKHGA